MATTPRKTTRTATTAASKGSPALADAMKTIASLPPARAAKPSAAGTLYGADAKGVPGKSAKVLAVKKPAAKKPAIKTGKKVGQLAKDMAQERNQGAAYDKKTTPGKVQKELDKKSAKALDKLTKPKASKVAIPTLKIGKIVIERPARKKSDSFDTVPTISVKGGADTIKVFSKMPKGFSWLTDLGSSTKDTLMIYNKHGVHIADIRTDVTHGKSK